MNEDYSKVGEINFKYNALALLESSSQWINLLINKYEKEGICDAEVTRLLEGAATDIKNAIIKIQGT